MTHLQLFFVSLRPLTLKTSRKPASENVICLYRLLHLLANFLNILFCIWANSVDPDQTAPRGAVWSGSTLFATMTFKVFSRRQSRRQFCCLMMCLKTAGWVAVSVDPDLMPSWCCFIFGSTWFGQACLSEYSESQRAHDVYTTSALHSMQHHDIASTLRWRCVNNLTSCAHWE